MRSAPPFLWLPQTGFPKGIVFDGFGGQGMMMAFDAQTLTRVADWTASPQTQAGDVGASGIWEFRRSFVGR